MLTWLRSQSLTGRTASALYGSIVAQAREPAFFADLGVPDTMEGRFGMIGVHMFLVLERLRREGNEGLRLGRALLETFATDIDDTLREIGVGDLSVPRRVKKAAAALHEHLIAYRAAIADHSLEGPLRSYVYLNRPEADASALAAYVQAALEALEREPWHKIAAGPIPFPSITTAERRRP